MEETYIIIEEDNERKILPEGPEIKEAHREAEERYRRLVEPPVKETGLEAIRQAFLKQAGKAEPPGPALDEKPAEGSVDPSPREMSVEEERPGGEPAESSEPAAPFTVLNEREVAVLEESSLGTVFATPLANDSASENDSANGKLSRYSAPLIVSAVALIGSLLLFIIWN